MKKTFISILSFLFILFLLPITVIAEDSEDYYRELTKETTNIFRNVTYTHMTAETRTDRPKGWDQGLNGSVLIDPAKWYGQNINIVDIPRGEEVKIVSWSSIGNMQFNMVAITEMAKDFEAKNPGWHVIAGINGDGYDWHTKADFPNGGVGVEMRDGDLTHFNKWRDTVAITNANSGVQLVHGAAGSFDKSDLPYLTIYDEAGNEIKTIKLDKFNAEIGEGETGAYFGYIKKYCQMDEAGNFVLDKNNEVIVLKREYIAPTVSTNGTRYDVTGSDEIVIRAETDSYFGKGFITKVNTTDPVDHTSFSIVTQNEELKALLKEGVKIRVQYQLSGSLANQENVMGIFKMMKQNNQNVPYTEEDYYSTRVPRTFITSKADGTVSFITVDGRQKGYNMYGINQQEINAFADIYGYTDVYMLDGGGSSTFFIKEGNKFVVKNSPSDGNVRNVGNCILAVVKDAEFNVSEVIAEDTYITLKVDTTNVDPTHIKNIKCTLDGVTKIVEDGEVTFEGLTPYTKHSYKFSYDTFEKADLETLITDEIYTARIKPTINTNITYLDGQVQFDLTVEDPGEALMYIRLTYNGERVLWNNKPIVFSIDHANLSEFTYTLTTCYDRSNGKGREVINEDITVKIEKTCEENPNQEKCAPTELTCEQDPNQEKCQKKEEPKKGCKKKSAGYIAIMTTISTIGLLFIKRKNH